MKNYSGFKVPPLSETQVEAISNRMRKAMFLLDVIYVDMIAIYEFILPKLYPVFHFEVIKISQMGNDHAKTFPNKDLIQIREDVYKNACENKGRDRFTLAHELGHWVMHRNIGFSQEAIPGPHLAYEDSEWQANTFASFFLMPTELVAKCKDHIDVAEKFKVSEQAAKVRWEKLKK